LSLSLEFEGLCDLGNDLKNKLNFTQEGTFDKDLVILNPDVAILSFEASFVDL
jgi:hypothetical protein